MNLKGHLKRRVNLKTFSSRIWSGAFAEMLGLEGGSWNSDCTPPPSASGTLLSVVVARW